MFVEIPYTSASGDRRSTLRIEYARHGDGPPVLYIGGSGRSLVDRPNAFDSPLAESFSVIAYDQRGLGRTGCPEGEWSMADYADDAAGLLDALSIDTAHVVGVSFGGMVAQELAIRHGSRVRRLVLVVTSPGGAGGSSYPIHTLDGLDRRERFELELALADTRRGPEWQAAHPDEVERLWERAEQSSDATAPTIGEHEQLDARRRHDCWDRLDRIESSTLVCAGRHDGVAPLENSKALVSRLRHGQLRVFDGGHRLLRQDATAWPTVVEFLGDMDSADQKSMLYY
jgi:3-oxoadipate enol-lactonase